MDRVVWNETAQKILIRRTGYREYILSTPDVSLFWTRRSVVAKLNRCGKSMPTLQDKRFKAGGVKGSLVLSPNVVASGPLIAPNKRDFKPVTHYPFRKKALLKSSILQAAKEVKKVYVE